MTETLERQSDREREREREKIRKMKLLSQKS